MNKFAFEGDIPKFDEEIGDFVAPDAPDWPGSVVLGVFGEPAVMNKHSMPGGPAKGIAEWSYSGPIGIPSGWTRSSYENPTFLSGTFWKTAYRNGDIRIVLEFDPASYNQPVESSASSQTYCGVYLDGEKHVHLGRESVSESHVTYLLPKDEEPDFISITGLGISICGMGRITRVLIQGAYFGKVPTIVFLATGELDAWYYEDAMVDDCQSHTMIWNDGIGEWEECSVEKSKGYAAKFGDLVSRRYPSAIVGIVDATSRTGTDSTMENAELTIGKARRALSKSCAASLSGILWQQGHIETAVVMDDGTGIRHEDKMQYEYEHRLYDTVWKYRGAEDIASWFTPFIAAPVPWMSFDHFNQMHPLDCDWDPATASTYTGKLPAQTASNGFGHSHDIAMRFYKAWARVIRGLSM